MSLLPCSFTQDSVSQVLVPEIPILGCGSHTLLVHITNLLGSGLDLQNFAKRPGLSIILGSVTLRGVRACPLKELELKKKTKS